MTTWQRGDLAMCLHHKGWFGIPNGEVGIGPKPGEIRKVDGFRIIEGQVDLLLEGYEQTNETGVRFSYQASCFRKVRPSAIGHVERLKAMLPAPKGKVGAA